jgi:transcriptional regulator GlxA family with amidase domain
MRHAGKTPNLFDAPAHALPSVNSSADDASTASDPLDARTLVLRLDAAPALPQRKRRASNEELRVGIVLWPKFPLLSLAGLCDGLRHAADVGGQSRQMRCSWTVLGNVGESVEASCGVKVPMERSFSSAIDYDYVAVIGGLLPSIGDVDPRHAAFLNNVAALGVPLIGICTGSFVLARLGLLKGHTPCIHPFHVDDWKAYYPTAPFETNSHYAFGENRITCAGGISIVELAVELVRLHCGPDRAAKVIHQMTVNSTNTATHVARRHALGYDSSDHDKLRQAVVLMEKNITTPLEISVIAKLVESSSRQLERVFLAETGSSPSEYYRNSRLKYARWLLTTTDLPIVTIAYESGFSDASHFIRHFQQLYGMAPGRLRKALQLRTSEV